VGLTLESNGTPRNRQGRLNNVWCRSGDSFRRFPTRFRLSRIFSALWRLRRRHALILSDTKLHDFTGMIIPFSSRSHRTPGRRWHVEPATGTPVKNPLRGESGSPGYTEARREALDLVERLRRLRDRHRRGQFARRIDPRLLHRLHQLGRHRRMRQADHGQPLSCRGIAGRTRGWSRL